MLVTHRVSGPSYSTDAVANVVTGFRNRRYELTCVRESPPSEGPFASLEELYPAWFVETNATRRGLAHRVRFSIAGLFRRRMRVVGGP